MSAFQLLQGANTLGLKKEEKPLSWYVWAPTWAEIREVTVGNYGLRSSIALGPTCVQVMVGGGEHAVPARSSKGQLLVVERKAKPRRWWKVVSLGLLMERREEGSVGREECQMMGRSAGAAGWMGVAFTEMRKTQGGACSEEGR